ncbi:MAG: hypothetical protein J2O44_01535 [Porphyrobacter sp.]|nr:hypothetical protein [Porphyrobacter sp.]
MKYGLWFVRLVFAAWMIPAGLNHFYPLFPQPMGDQPLSKELITALLDSHQFDLTKAVELLAGLAVLTGFYAPLMLVVCMPVSFCVWYWDVPLQGWSSASAVFGWAVLGSNAVLCLSYVDTYRSMLAPRATPRGGKNAVLAGRVIFGAFLLLSGANRLFGPFLPLPEGHQPLAVELMTALVDSRLIDVVAGLQLVGGTLILAGLFVPLALCVVMPLSVCAAFWAVALEHEPFGAVIALAALALNAWLMLVYIDAYRPMLQRRVRAAFEEPGEGRSYDTLYAIPLGRVSPAQFGGALIVLVAAAAFYHFLVPGRTGQFALLTLAYPALVLIARLLQGMGRGGPATPEPA